jgi:hypothetical protein
MDNSGQSEATDEGRSVARNVQGLELEARILNTVLVKGTTAKVTALVRNTTDQPITIQATNSAKVLVKIYEPSGMAEGSWRLVKTYPEAAAMVITNWTLSPEQYREFTLPLKVEPDWPSEKELRLEVIVNGADLSASIPVEVVSGIPEVQ